MKFFVQKSSGMSLSFRSFKSIIIALGMLISLWASDSALAVNASSIEAAMRDYQSKYHYVAVVNSSSSKYLTWPSHDGVAAPSYPSGFYGEITEQKATELVNSIINLFYYNLSTQIYYYFIEDPEGQSQITTVTVTAPDSGATWQEKLSQVNTDLDKLVYYRVYPGMTAETANQGDGSSRECDLHVCCGSGSDQHSFGNFDQAQADAEGNWDTAWIPGMGVGIYASSSLYYACYTVCDCVSAPDYLGNEKIWSVLVASKNAKLTADLTKHSGSATAYLKATMLEYADDEGATTAVTVDGTFHSWQSASVGQEWVSDYLFDDTPPQADDPGTPGCNSSVSRTVGWELSDTVIVVEPEFPNDSDPVLSCSAPTVEVYKDQDKNIVYSAARSCGCTEGETVRGRIKITDYDPLLGMSLQIRLDRSFSGTVAQLTIGGDVINSHDTQTVHLPFITQDATSGEGYVPFEVAALTGEATISFSMTTSYSQPLGEAATDPNQAERIQAYRGEGQPERFCIRTNGYECCNRSATLDMGNPYPTVKKHENGDVEMFFPDIRQSYIWGCMSIDPMFQTTFYSKTCGFLDVSAVDFTPTGGGDYVKLTQGSSRILAYSTPSSWHEDATNSNASFQWELDINDAALKTAGYDGNGRLSTVSEGTGSSVFSRQYHYDAPSYPNRVTSYTDYTGSLSRTYTLVYDQTTGDLRGTVGGTGGGCSSCALSGGNRLYTFTSDGRIATESDTENIVLYEYEYDEQDRQVAKWSGPKTISKPIQIITYNESTLYGGAEIQDIYDYVTNTDYYLTRNVLDADGQTLLSIQFDDLNVNASSLSGDLEEVAAGGGQITTYDYTYNGTILTSIATQSPRFYNGDSDVYRKQTFNGTQEREYLVQVNPDESETETEISRNIYTYTSNNLSRLLNQSVDARGIEDSVGTTYTYTTQGRLQYRYDPIMTYPNGQSSQRYYYYTYHPDGRMATEQVWASGVGLITTTLYDSLGNPAGTEVRDESQNLLYTTLKRCNGFGEEIYSIDRSGVAYGKEYDGAGKVVSEFVFADPNDTLLFDGDDPNVLTEDISGLYANLEVVSQTRYVYDGFGRLWQTWVAVSDDVFQYDQPTTWYGTQIVYDSEGRQIQQIEDVNGLSLTTTYEYNRQGQRIKTTWPDGRWQKQVYDGRGLQIETIDGYGPEFQGLNETITRQTIYDADGHVIKELIDGQVTVSYELDEQGRVFRQYQGDFAAGPCNYTEYARNLAGDVLSQRTVQVDAQQNETVISQTQNQYNVLGQRFEQRQLADADGEPNDLTDRISLYSYDMQGRLIETLTKGPGNSQIYVDNAAVYQVGDAVEQTWYDMSGNPAYHIRLDCQETCYPGSGCTIPMPFEEIDEVFQYAKTHQKIVLERFDYDGGKQTGKAVLAGFDPNDPNWAWEPQAGLIWRQTENVDYDTAGRIEKTTDADDNFKTYRYNSRNQQTEQTVWQGRPVLRWRDFEDDPNFIAYPVRKILTGYDVAGRQSRTALLLDPNSSSTIQSVDLALDRVTDFVYDEYGRLYRQRQYFDGENKRIAYQEYMYDGFSRMGAVEHGELEEVFWPGGGLLSETKTPHKTVGYAYNAQNQVIQQTATLVNTATEQTTSMDNSYSYDTFGRLIQTDNADGTMLVFCQHSIDGYSLFSFILASSVVNCQSTFLPAAFRAASHAFASKHNCSTLFIRLARHCLLNIPNSISAISNQLPCLGV